MPQCPKCKHRWGKPPGAGRKAKPDFLSGSFAVFPQRCWGCEKEIGAGERVYASVRMPVVACIPCAKKYKISGLRGDRMVLIDDIHIPHSCPPVKKKKDSVWNFCSCWYLVPVIPMVN